MLTRIYGTAWETVEQLEEHRRLRVEAARRDHRKIGKDLDLFSIQQDAGGGLVFWHPKGAQVRSLLELTLTLTLTLTLALPLTPTLKPSQDIDQQ